MTAAGKRTCIRRSENNKNEGEKEEGNNRNVVVMHGGGVIRRGSRINTDRFPKRA